MKKKDKYYFSQSIKYHYSTMTLLINLELAVVIIHLVLTPLLFFLWSRSCRFNSFPCAVKRVAAISQSSLKLPTNLFMEPFNRNVSITCHYNSPVAQRTKTGGVQAHLAILVKMCEHRVV